MKIQIYGMNCAKCHDLANNAEQALKELKKEGNVEHVTDINKMAEKGIMLTPSLVVNGEIVSEGRILSVDEIKRTLVNK